MNSLKFYRKPYLAYVMGFMILFVSCKQYDNNEIQNVEKNINFKKRYQEIKRVKNIINSVGIKNLKDINEVKKKLINNKINNKSNSDITEYDINQAYSILDSLGYLNENTNYYDLMYNSIIYAYNNDIISEITKNFLITEFSSISNINNLSNDITNFVNNNNLNNTERDFLIFAKNNIQSNRMVNCHVVGVAAGVFSSVLIGSVSGGIGAAIAGAIFSAAISDAVEGICEQA